MNTSNTQGQPSVARTGLVQRLLLAVCLVSAAVLPPGALAQAWPNRPVKLVVAGPVGSSLDVVARSISDALADELKQSVVVDARVGAGGLVAIQVAKQMSADGHAILLAGAAGSIIAPLTFRAPKVNFVAEWIPAATLAVSPLIIVTGDHGRTDATLPAMLRNAKAHPDKVSMGNPLIGTTPHLTAELLGRLSGARFYHVVVGNAGPAISAVLNGDVDYYVDSVGVVMPLIRQGRLKALAVTAPQVYPGLEDIPLAKDTVPGMTAMSWFALFMPAGTPADVVQRVNGAVAKVLARPDVVARLQTAGAYALVSDVPGTADFVRKERDLWGGVIQQIGLLPQ